MGFDTVIVAFFVITTMIVVANTFMIGMNDFVDSAYDGYSAIHTTTMDKMQTDIEIQTIWFNSTENHLHFIVENTGETKLNNFNLWDIIVIKNGTADYMDDNKWTMDVYDGQLNPNILDPLEEMEVELHEEYGVGDEIILKIVTPNGIISSKGHTIGG
ncbi:flagellar protein FlaF [Methanococcoides methylutens]|uniref:Flagellar protein FlaF n=1 Tax=Methanococcoides methylutens TaxID=2226 RepID=A0A099T174_METMT|nr:flagellar protein FlaF [Methanococcoides methylutens]KGK97976.1 flagellar protein FlaF [Methanococcoides methylutens]